MKKKPKLKTGEIVWLNEEKKVRLFGDFRIILKAGKVGKVARVEPCTVNGDPKQIYEWWYFVEFPIADGIIFEIAFNNEKELHKRSKRR